jgi:hypothetical protein
MARRTEITAKRVVVDYRVGGDRLIEVTDDQGNPVHIYKNGPTPDAFDECFKKVSDNVHDGTQVIKFRVDVDGNLLPD